MGGKHWELRLESRLTVKKYLWPRLIIPARKDLFLLSLHPFSLALISSYFLHSLVPVVFVPGDCGPLAFLTPWGSVCLVISSDCLATAALFNVNCVWAATYFFFLNGARRYFGWTKFYPQNDLTFYWPWKHLSLNHILSQLSLLWSQNNKERSPSPLGRRCSTVFWGKREKRTSPHAVGLVLFQLRVLVVTVERELRIKKGGLGLKRWLSG